MKALSYLIVIFLTPAVILLNFRIFVFNKSFYQSLQSQSQIEKSLNSDLANFQTEKIIDYLCCKGELNENFFFTSQEVLHMQDVKYLIVQAKLHMMLNLSLLLIVSGVLVYKKKHKLLTSALKISSIVGIGTIAILGIFSSLSFDFLFTRFHLISFSNDLWMLPPESNLLKLFPPQFFQAFANKIAYTSFLMLLLIFLLAMLSEKLSSQKNKVKH